jgi:hypothetical protein
MVLSALGATAATSARAEVPLGPVGNAETETCISDCQARCEGTATESSCTRACGEACGASGPAEMAAPVATPPLEAEAAQTMTKEGEERVRADERARVSALYAADELTRDRKSDNEADEKIGDAIVTPMGLYAFVGGGATNFTQPTAVGATNVGGFWDARLGIGTRSILGAEVGYVGSARNIEALGLNSDAYLFSTGVEGVARLNVPVTMEKVLFEPYTFGGVGWNRYNLMTDGANTSSIDDQDDVMTVPLGVGIALGFSGVTLDVRGTYRQTFGANLFGTQTSSFDDTSMNSWGAGGSLGFEL